MSVNKGYYGGVSILSEPHHYYHCTATLITTTAVNSVITTAETTTSVSNNNVYCFITEELLFSDPITQFVKKKFS